MSLAGQNLQPQRYRLIPRTLTFLLAADQVLLLELPHSKGSWAGKLNGVGGHVERGENPKDSALREIREETGLHALELRLCGVAIIDSQQDTGIGLYIFVGEAQGELVQSDEGRPQWHKITRLKPTQLVADLPTIMPLAIENYRQGKPPFCALYSYSQNGDLTIELGAPFDEE